MSIADIINRELRTNPYVKKEQIDPAEFDDVGCEDDLPYLYCDICGQRMPCECEEDE